ncbi:hypothetical protein GW17_00010023 [Ensete ventricosum]|nr:hypothetical protein GW17_00010023 [Ensete ventricosum]
MSPYRRILPEEDHSNYDKEGSATPPCPPPLPSAPPLHIDNHHGRHLVSFLLIPAAIVTAALLLSITYYAVLRRRRRPVRSASFVDSNPDGNDDDTPLDDGEPFHHVWYIRTVGLDEATIRSIAVAEYRTGDGLLDGASDCSVCLGEFRDGELVRLLPKCGHAFHVPCIDAWLGAHVNCPICRAHIVDPNGEISPPAAAPAPSVTVSAGSFDFDSGFSAPAEDPHRGIQPPEEQRTEETLESMIAIGIPINTSEAFHPTPGSSASQVQDDKRDFGLHQVRRSVSMDTPLMNSIIVRVRPEESMIDEEGKDETFEEETVQINGVKRGSSSKGIVVRKEHSDIERSLSCSGRGFFFSRHGNARIHSMPM